MLVGQFCQPGPLLHTHRPFLRTDMGRAAVHHARRAYSWRTARSAHARVESYGNPGILTTLHSNLLR
jgi:hypothetical protein